MGNFTKILIIISQCSRQETNTLSPEGLHMSNIAVKLRFLMKFLKIIKRPKD
jgi:hypothetical protein